MERHEIKSRVDAKLDEWKRHLDVMRVKVDASESDATATHREELAALEKQHDELRAKAAQTLDHADDESDTDVEDVERALDEWAERAARTRDDLMK